MEVRSVLWRSLAVALLTVGAHAQDLHKDARLGFQLRVPRGWKQIPVRSDEAWIVGKYRAPKPERTVDPTSGYTLQDYPELLIVAILRPSALPVAEVEQKKEEEQEGGDAEEAAASVAKYRDYQEYMRENYGHGHFVEREEAAKQGDLAVTRLEIKAERDLNFSEKRIIAWVYETEIADIAVHLEVPAESYKKLSSTINDSLKSFKTVPRTEELRSPIEAGFLSSVDLAKLTPAERKLKKIEAQMGLWEQMSRDLPDGWSASEISGVHVLNHADDRYAKKVVEHIRAIYAWLESTFSEVGQHEYARPPIVRICEDQAEEAAFRSGSGTYGVGGTLLVTHKGTRAESWEWEYIGSRALNIWFQERAPKLWGTLPRWLEVGLQQVVSSARLQSGKLVFEMGDLEKFTREDLPRGDQDALDVRTLIMMSEEEFNAFGERDDWRTWCQAVALTRFFVEARSKKTRELFVHYLNNMQLVLAELESQEDQDPTKQGAKKPENEEEEEQLFKEREKWLEARERTILERVLQLTFPGWSVGDWRGLDRDFRRSL